MRGWLVLAVALGVCWLLAWWYRRRTQWHAADHVRQITHWYARDPQIEPLDLPEVKKLRGVRTTPWEKLRRVK